MLAIEHCIARQRQHTPRTRRNASIMLAVTVCAGRVMAYNTGHGRAEGNSWNCAATVSPKPVVGEVKCPTRCRKAGVQAVGSTPAGMVSEIPPNLFPFASGPARTKRRNAIRHGTRNGNAYQPRSKDVSCRVTAWSQKRGRRMRAPARYEAARWAAQTTWSAMKTMRYAKMSVARSATPWHAC